MSLQRRKKRLRIRAPELIALLIVGLALIATALWLQGNFKPNWQDSVAIVTYGDVYKRAYSPDPTPDQVHLTYQYSAQGKTYTDFWEGYWPKAHSPNALPTERLRELCQSGHLLAIVFDPTDPTRNILHYTGNDYTKTYERIGLAAILLALAYMLKVYPTWKLRN
jgi:hypothetical protein